MASAAPTSTFFGSQPRRAHVPPNGRESITATLHPARRHWWATTPAAVPVPITTRSNWCGIRSVIGRHRNGWVEGRREHYAWLAAIGVWVPCVTRSIGDGAAARAARQVTHILLEGLRRQLQPLDHCEVREQLVSEFMDGHPRADRQGSGLDDLPRLWSDRLHAEEATRTGVGDELDEAAGVEVDQGTRHGVQRERAGVGLDILVVGLCVREPDGCHLRIGE